MSFLDSILSFLNSIPNEVWTAIIEVVVGAIIVSPVVLAIKRWRDIHSEKIMLALVIGGSFITAALLYLRSVPEFAPWAIAVQGWLVFATTQPVYIYLVKPLSIRIGIWFNGKVAAVAIANEAKSAAIPATGMPVTVGGSEDFGH